MSLLSLYSWCDEENLTIGKFIYFLSHIVQSHKRVIKYILFVQEETIRDQSLVMLLVRLL